MHSEQLVCPKMRPSRRQQPTPSLDEHAQLEQGAPLFVRTVLVKGEQRRECHAQRVGDLREMAQ